MIEANRVLLRRWFQEVWNGGREKTIDELLADDAVAYGLGDTDVEVRGPSQLKPFVHNLRGALPDLHVRIEDILADGDKVMVRLVVTGTHTGDGPGVPPSGKRVRFAGIVLVRVFEGQIIEVWNSWDQLGLLRQIGALPAVGAEDRFLSARS